MNYQVIVSNKANQLIKEYLVFIANVSKEAAIKQNRIFKEAINKIAEDPKIYPFFESDFIPSSKYHKFVISKRYIILYQIIDDTIFIDYVIDTRQDYSWLLR